MSRASARPSAAPVLVPRRRPATPAPTPVPRDAPQPGRLRTDTVADLRRTLRGEAPPAALPATAAIADLDAAADAAVCAVLGVKTIEVGNPLLMRMVALTPTQLRAPSPDTAAVQALALLGECQPTTAIEACLSVQMMGVHNAATLFLIRATLPEQTIEGAERNVLRAVRLMRLFNEQLETLQKVQGKTGQQRVIVEHVTVHEGGQAIVGAVSTQLKTRGRGGGGG
ncbi:MAG TPA: hypothetical protein VK595_15870 [Vicinamibacterales bacterium]|nr:hypothetical protein [Vicinamibacterales bacterium]